MLLRWIERCAGWTRENGRRVATMLSRLRSPAEVLDPDIREVFLAELDELSATLTALLPQLRREPEDPATLQALRRAFHTIKGSGLMTGALSLANVCSQLEKLAVNLIERRRTATPELLQIFETAIALLPACRRSLEAGAPLPAAMRAVGMRAEALLATR